MTELTRKDLDTWDKQQLLKVLPYSTISRSTDLDELRDMAWLKIQKEITVRQLITHLESLAAIHGDDTKVRSSRYFAANADYPIPSLDCIQYLEDCEFDPNCEPGKTASYIVVNAEEPPEELNPEVEARWKP